MEWWKKLPDFWKVVTTVITGIVLVIGTFQGVNAYFTKRCDFDEHKIKHNKDIAEVSESFRRYQIRQEMRTNNSEQYEVEKKLRTQPTEEDRARLRKLQLEKEELEKDWQEIKTETKTKK